jgi:hypothetical protein
LVWGFAPPVCGVQKPGGVADDQCAKAMARQGAAG